MRWIVTRRAVGSYSGRLRSLRGYRARIELQHAAAQVEVTRAMRCAIRLTNVGDRAWRSGGWHPVHLSYHWRIGAQATEGIRFSLPADIQPGEQTVIECAVPAPADEGDYVLEFDLVREHVGWFKHNGSPTLPIERTLRDYDYQSTYQQADLENDYWSVVGPATKEEYEYLGRYKRQTLIALGMNAHSRIIDVGCGTGQLAEALEDYLSADAVYYGTDISQEVITFCQKKFRRPNFFFVKNDMSRVPVDGLQFDVIFLASVFTHMYPAEIQAMLLDLKRLLAPDGLIIADAFVSPKVATFAGSRAKVEINQGLLQDVFEQTGLRHEIQGSTIQPDGGSRLGFVFRH